MLGMAVVVSHFAAVEAEAQEGTGKDPRPSVLGVSAGARQVTTGDSVPSVVNTVHLPPAPIGGERLWGRR